MNEQVEKFIDRKVQAIACEIKDKMEDVAETVTVSSSEGSGRPVHTALCSLLKDTWGTALTRGYSKSVSGPYRPFEERMVITLSGPRGAGHTQALERLVRERAQGESDIPFPGHPVVVFPHESQLIRFPDRLDSGESVETVLLSNVESLRGRSDIRSVWVDAVSSIPESCRKRKIDYLTNIVARMEPEVDQPGPVLVKLG